MERVDTRLAPPDQPVVVLGPFVHPVSGLLTVKCILLSLLEDCQLSVFGQCFAPMDMSERGVMVPDRDMIMDLQADLRLSDLPNKQVFRSVLLGVNHNLKVGEAHLEQLDEECADTPDFQKRVRSLCKCFYEMALYYRRYAGPGRKVPLGLLRGVGDPSNPLSASLRGKFVSGTMAGVRLTDKDTTTSFPADTVLDPEGTLTNMSRACKDSILIIYDSFTARQRIMVDACFTLGTPYRIVNGNGRFYMDTVDPDFTSGNDGLELNLFDICFGTPHGETENPRGFHANASVYGTETYCVQVVAIQIIRSIQTILPYVYKTRPAWALVDGEFENVHT